MRILILGGDGMLGHQLYKSWQARHEVYVTLHGSANKYQNYGLFNDEFCKYDVDVIDYDRLKEVVCSFKPEVIVNAVGIIKQRDSARDAITSIEVNALLPHQLASLCHDAGARLIHLSTDCVFSGNKGGYSIEDTADADDLYGRTKYLGEVSYNDCITLRTSIIGLELKNKKSLIEWFLAQKGQIDGYSKAIYSGITTLEISRVIETLLLDYPGLSGVYHVASSPIDKCTLLTMLSEKLNRTDIDIVSDDEFKCDHSLRADEFNKITNYRAPDWDTMLAELAEQIKERGDKF